MERDVVCGMQVDPAKAAARSEYNGKTYYFCSSSCKIKFEAIREVARERITRTTKNRIVTTALRPAFS